VLPLLPVVAPPELALVKPAAPPLLTEPDAPVVGPVDVLPAAPPVESPPVESLDETTPSEHLTARAVSRVSEMQEIQRIRTHVRRGFTASFAESRFDGMRWLPRSLNKKIPRAFRALKEKRGQYPTLTVVYDHASSQPICRIADRGIARAPLAPPRVRNADVCGVLGLRGTRTRPRFPVQRHPIFPLRLARGRSCRQVEPIYHFDEKFLSMATGSACALTAT
jgi:hypothetical protein